MEVLGTGMPPRPSVRRSLGTGTDSEAKKLSSRHSRSNSIRSQQSATSNSSQRSLFKKRLSEQTAPETADNDGESEDIQSQYSFSSSKAPSSIASRDGASTYDEDDNASKSKLVHGLFAEEKAQRCRNGHIKISGQGRRKSSGLSCDVCLAYIGHQTNHCMECSINYCSNCNMIRRFSLKELLLHQDCLKLHGHKPMIDDQLVAYGIEIAEADNEGEFPLHIAIKNEAPARIIEIILCAYPGAAAIKDPYGYLPIHLAAMFNCEKKVVEMLLDYHFNGIMERDPDGLVPLYLALKYKSPESVIECLISNYPAVMTPYGRGKKALVKASKRNVYVACTLLSADMATMRIDVMLESGKRFKVTDADIRLETTILHFAVQNKAEPTVLELLLRECPLLAFLRDINGELAFHLAVKNQSNSLIICTLIRANKTSCSIFDNNARLPVYHFMERIAEREVEYTGESKDLASIQKNGHTHSWLAFLSKLNSDNLSVQSLLGLFRVTIMSKKKLKVPTKQEKAAPAPNNVTHSEVDSSMEYSLMSSLSSMTSTPAAATFSSRNFFRKDNVFLDRSASPPRDASIVTKRPSFSRSNSQKSTPSRNSKSSPPKDKASEDALQMML